MKIVYRSHLLIRLRERKIPDNYPRLIARDPDLRLFDVITKHVIAVKKLLYLRKMRSMVIAYDIIKGRIEIITIHPISESEIQNKIKSKRWKFYENN